jgi:outer membrane protein OmpA-like peptidoglycan-associated protein/TolA-binding protein
VKSLPALAVLILLLGGCAYYNTFYNARTAYTEGMKMVDAGNATAAKPKFESAIKKSAAVIKNYSKSSWVDDALYLVGLSYFQMGDYTRAISKFDNLEAAFPNSPFRDDAQFYKARSLIGDGQYAKGIGILKSLKEKSRRLRPDAAFELAATGYRQNDYAAAVPALQAFDAEYPRSKHTRELRLMLADAYFRLGRFSEANAAFCQHRRLATHSRERLPDDLNIADCYLMSNSPDSALVLMQKQPLDRFPEYSDRINLITGKALFALDRKADARAALSKVKAGAFSAEAFFLIGQSFEQDTGFDQAYAYYDTARTREPNSLYGVQSNSRRLLIDRLLKGLRGEGDTAQAKFLLAEVYHTKLGQDSTALVHYRRVADSFPASDFAPKALYAVAWIKQRLKYPDTTQAWQTVIDRYPRTVFAQEARKALGLTLLPEWQIEPPPEVKAESLKAKALRDSAIVRKARADSLARLAEITKPDTLAPSPPPAEPPVSGRSERGRDRRSGRERPATPPSAPGIAQQPPAGPAPGELPPNAPKVEQQPPAGPTRGEMPPKPEVKPGTPAQPSPSPHGEIPGPETPAATPPPPKPETPAEPKPEPKPDTVKPVVKPPPESVKPETAQKPAPLLPKPETIARPEVRPETAQRPAPVKSETRPPTRSGGSFFPDSGMGAVFFGFDSTRIRSEDTAMLRANAEYVNRHPELELILVGFCDSAGEPTYNLTLGLRRAQAVRRWLVRYGIEPSRIGVHSYGSEWAFGTEPDYVWQDRRCEFWTRLK